MLRPRQVYTLRSESRAQAFIAILGAAVVASTALVASAGPASASADSDRAQITQLEQRISEQGAHMKDLVTRYNEVAGHVAEVDAQIARDQKILVADQQVEASAKVMLSRVAVDAYVNGGALNLVSPLVFTGNSPDITSMFEQSRYLGAVNNRMTGALDRLKAAQADTRAEESTLKSEHDEANKTLQQLAQAHDAAQNAIASDEAMLRNVKGNLRVVLAAEAEQHAAQERAQERALAAARLSQVSQSLAARPAPRSSSVSPSSSGSSSSSSSSSISAPATVTPAAEPAFASSPPPPPPPRPVSVAPGGYANPLRAISGLTPERIDQGVDFAGFGPIYAIGNGIVLSTSIPGWPGGTYIAIRLSNGPAAGLVVYSAEDISPSVQVGDRVSANTVIGQMYAGPDGIELGWGDGSAIGNTMARTYGQFNGPNSTAFGANFSQLLQSVGAPGGVMQSNPTGSLPAGWPRW